MRISIYKSRKKIILDVRKVSLLGKFYGLMFRTRRTKNLLFEFSRETNLSIHSFFVFFTFLAVWLDDKNRIVESRIVKPFIFSIKPKKKFRKLAEIPFNNENKKILKKLGFPVGEKRFK